MTADILRRAATKARESGDPVLGQVGTLLSMAADHAAGRGAVCDSCVTQAQVVARAILNEPEA